MFNSFFSQPYHSSRTNSNPKYYFVFILTIATDVDRGILASALAQGDP